MKDRANIAKKFIFIAGILQKIDVTHKIQNNQ